MIRAVHALPLLTTVAVAFASPVLLTPVAAPALATHVGHAAPNVRVVDHPRVTQFQGKGPLHPWLIWARLDVLWDPRTTPGCQVTMRLERSRDGLRSWQPHTEWKTFQEFDGNLTAQLDSVALPGQSYMRAAWQLDCPPNPGSGQKPYRRPVTLGYILNIRTPHTPSEAPEPDSVFQMLPACGVIQVKCVPPLPLA